MFLAAVVFLVICFGTSAMAWRFGRIAGGREAVMRIDTNLHLNQVAATIGVSAEERLAATLRVLRIDRAELNSGLPFKQRIIQPKETA